MSTFKRFTATAALALAAGPLMLATSLSAHAAGASDASLEANVQSALTSAMGDNASRVTVTAENGDVVLHGWVTGARQISQARTVASKVPGAGNVYSHMRFWTTDREQ